MGDARILSDTVIIKPRTEFLMFRGNEVLCIQQWPPEHCQRHCLGVPYPLGAWNWWPFLLAFSPLRYCACSVIQPQRVHPCFPSSLSLWTSLPQGSFVYIFSRNTHSLHCYFFSNLTTASQPFILIFVLLSSFSHEDSNSQACLCPALKLQHVFLIRIPVIIRYLQHLIILFPLSPNWFKDYLPNYLA